MKRTLGIVLLVIGLTLGVLGFSKLDQSKADIEIGPLELSAQDGDQRNKAYTLLAIGAIGLVGGLVIINKK